jgi:hypothetical protein
METILENYHFYIMLQGKYIKIVKSYLSYFLIKILFIIIIDLLQFKQLKILFYGELAVVSSKI